MTILNLFFSTCFIIFFELCTLTPQILTTITCLLSLRKLRPRELRVLSILNLHVPNWLLKLLTLLLQQTYPLSFPHFSSGDPISPVAQAKNLGVILDSLTSLTSHFWPDTKSCGCYLQDTARIWSHVQHGLTMKCSFFTGLPPYTTEQSSTVLAYINRNLPVKIRSVFDLVWPLIFHLLHKHLLKAHHG